MVKLPEATNKKDVLDFILRETLRSFKKIRDLEESGEENKINYDLETAADRKAAISLKTVLAEIHQENTAHRRVELESKIKNGM